jgi:F420-dependent oxidoreductase-like protein
MVGFWRKNAWMETRLPAPSLIVLVGPSSAGKTTWATEHFAANEVVSTDTLRAMAGTGPDDQEAGTAAFDLLETIVDERLRRGLTTVIDTLGSDAKRRQSWIERSHEVGIPVYAVVFDTPMEECERRNDQRTRPLPKTVLRKQFTGHAGAVEAITGESFDGVLTEQPIAVVAPQFIQDAGAESAEKAKAKHTFGLILSRFDWPGEREERAEQVGSVARRAEAAGFRDLWVMDHFRQIPQVGRQWEDMPESYTTLSYIAGITSTIRLGALVAGVTYRNPAHLGKIVATLDFLSGGRANCGIGAAWDEAEHRGYGWDFPDTSFRYDLLEDTLAMLPLLWGKGSPSFEGKVFQAEELICYPRPLQEHIPILVGGSGERKTLRLVAEYADACNVFGDPDRVRHKVEVLEAHCKAVERDPAEIEVTHLTNVVAAPDRKALRDRIEQLRGRSTVEDYSRRNNAGTPDDHLELFTAYSEAGASHSIVSLPDVHLGGSIEAFAEVITAFEAS